MKPAADETQRLIELVAAWDHSAWAGWTRHMLDNLTPENIARWRRQIDTSYTDLSEREKDADRKEAISVLALVQSWIDGALEAATMRERELREELERDSVHAREMQALLGKQRDEIERLREARLHEALRKPDNWGIGSR
jgi:hypothetical protein